MTLPKRFGDSEQEAPQAKRTLTYCSQRRSSLMEALARRGSLAAIKLTARRPPPTRAFPSLLLRARYGCVSRGKQRGTAGRRWRASSGSTRDGSRERDALPFAPTASSRAPKSNGRRAQRPEDASP